MVTSSTAGTVQLSPQVSECLSLDLDLFFFIRSSVQRHQSGDFGHLFGPDPQSCALAYQFSSSYTSIYEYERESSQLYGPLLLVSSPGARSVTLVSFVGELF